jgi:hypothetical protein
MIPTRDMIDVIASDLVDAHGNGGTQNLKDEVAKALRNMGAVIIETMAQALDDENHDRVEELKKLAEEYRR